MSTIIGTTVKKGAPVVSGYIVQSVTSGGADVDFEDIIDHVTGMLVTRLVHQIYGKISMVAHTDKVKSAIETDFPEGAISTIFGTHYVDSCNIEQTRSAWRVTASLTDIGIA